MSTLARAYFIRTADEAGGGASSADAPEGAGTGNAGGDTPAKAVPVQFNPLTLQYSLAINNPQAGAQPSTTQHVAQAEATLEMDLVFDTTPSGQDVRAHTVPLRNLALAPQAPAGSTTPAADQAPPKVAFVWGTFRFVGVVSGFRETLDFFSAEGVPLRSGAHLSLRGTQNSEAFTPPARSAQLGSGLGLDQSLGQLGRSDAAAARNAGAALGAGSLRAGVGLGAGAGIGLGGAVSVQASLSLGGSAAAGGGSRSIAALEQLAGVQASARVQDGSSVGVGGEFGFGGALQARQPAGLRARLGSLDFSAGTS